MDRPAWRFADTDKAGPFKWPANESTELRILQELRKFDSMGWSEIEGPRHHAIEPDSLSHDAKKRLGEIGRDDAPALFSFAINGKERVFAIRIGGIAHLLWWDPKHLVCPSHKKHT